MKALGYHIITGDLDTRDREFSTPETSQQAKDIFRTALREREAVGHMLPVMHDNLMQTVHNLAIDALRQLQNNNWSGVTVGECLGDPEPQWYRN